jgi:hypothetical protein
MRTNAMALAHTAWLTIDSFSAAALGMSPAKPTFIVGSYEDGFISSTSRWTRASSVSPPASPIPVVEETMRRPIIVPSSVSK